jgi:hypothetical protein
MCAKRRNHIVDGETRCVSISEHACGESPEPTFVLAWGVSPRRRGADE